MKIPKYIDKFYAFVSVALWRWIKICERTVDAVAKRQSALDSAVQARHSLCNRKDCPVMAVASAALVELHQIADRNHTAAKLLFEYEKEHEQWVNRSLKDYGETFDATPDDITTTKPLSVQTLRGESIEDGMCASSEELWKYRQQSWDVVIDEQSGVLRVYDLCEKQLADVHNDERRILWFCLNRAGRKVFRAEISGSVGDIDGSLEKLARTLGPGLYARIITERNSDYFVVSRNWSFCWVRKANEPQNSFLFKHIIPLVRFDN